MLVPSTVTQCNLEEIILLKTKHNLFYIRNQSVPRCKHFLPISDVQTEVTVLRLAYKTLE
jgi:hypothetical protein